jgi:hypothetical protein
MTRTNKATRSGSSRARRRLVILPVVLALGLAPAAPALATGSSTTGYAEPGAKKPTPASGTSPSKSTKTPTTPSRTVEPASASSAPTTTAEPAKASSLPFTGFDLRWTVGGGLLLMIAGGSIMAMQRLKRRDSGL